MKITPDPHYPRWLKTSDYRTNQTSGITFIGQNQNQKVFLLADDIGKIHRLEITDDTVFSFNEIIFSDKAEFYFSDYPKLDFEEIFYDRYTKNVYLSVEGNDDNYLNYNGIFILRFKNNEINSNEIISVERLKIIPEDEFSISVMPNIGFEGFTADTNNFYAGLEGIKNNSGFADSSLLYIIDKSELEIIKILSTKKFDIQTICGLYADEEGKLWLLDRNKKNLAVLVFDSSLNIVEYDKWDLEASVPGFKDYSYISSFEGITIDDDSNIYIVDDPWMKMFIPPDSILHKFDSATANNFRNYVPVIYKYKLTN